MTSQGQRCSREHRYQCEDYWRQGTHGKLLSRFKREIENSVVEAKPLRYLQTQSRHYSAKPEIGGYKIIQGAEKAWDLKERKAAGWLNQGETELTEPPHSLQSWGASDLHASSQRIGLRYMEVPQDAMQVPELDL